MIERGYHVSDFQFFYLLVSSISQGHTLTKEDILHHSHKLVAFGIVDAVHKLNSKHPSLLYPLFTLFAVTLPLLAVAIGGHVVVLDYLFNVAVDQLFQVSLDNEWRLALRGQLLELSKKILELLHYSSDLRAVLMVSD
jgi:hypothetical protein